MPSLPPCDGPASLTDAGIHTIGMAIKAASATSGTSRIVAFLDNIINTSVDSVLALVPPFTNCWGEYHTFGKQSNAIRPMSACA